MAVILWSHNVFSLCRHLASAEGCYSAVAWLLAQGVDVNAIDRFKRTPLEVRSDHVFATSQPCSTRQGHYLQEPHRPLSVDSDRRRAVRVARKVAGRFKQMCVIGCLCAT